MTNYQCQDGTRREKERQEAWEPKKRVPSHVARSIGACAGPRQLPVPLACVLGTCSDIRGINDGLRTLQKDVIWLLGFVLKYHLATFPKRRVWRSGGHVRAHFGIKQ